MESSSAGNGETKIAEKAVGQENHTDENYRQEIEDIVRGFIIEKDILVQSHEEEINRMKRRFDLERKQLLKQLEIDREQMIEASRITDSEQEVNLALSNALISDSGQMQSFSHRSGEGYQFLSGFQRRLNGGADIDDVDSNLIREIAEVYLRINNGTLTSQMRPELDLEDKYEREREALERSFQLEKRELKRKLEEDCYTRLEQERIKYEANIADLKTTISELQWQKREAESLVRHEKEKWEMNAERDKNEMEKRHLQIIQETRRKLEEKHSNDLERQRDRYEENIFDQQTDISKLTMQLKELNENLNQEKEIIVSKFEREVKEMEQAFLEQRNSLKANFEAEFMMRIENETSLLKSLNMKLKEDLESMEKEKKDVERRAKEERRKIEERFEEEISEMEQRQSEEKRALKIKLEERYQQGLFREKGGMEETIQELSEEIALLKQENAQMEVTFAERRDELQRQLDIEREEMRREAMNNREEIRKRVEQELSQKFMLENETRDDAFRHRERDVLMIQAKYDDLEMQLNALRQEREMLLTDKENLQENLKAKEKRFLEMNNDKHSGSNHESSVKMKEMIKEKENELAGVKFENQQLELSLSAMRREKSDMEDEIANLKRRLSNSGQQFGGFGHIDNGESMSLQERTRRKEEELSSLKRNKHELEHRLSSFQRKNEELEDELASLRRKKLEVEDEISALKRDKSESDNQVTSLKKDKAELEAMIANLKRKQSDLEDTMSAMKREKVELEHEVALLRRQNSTMEIEVYRHFNDQQEYLRPVYHKHEHEHVSRNNTKETTDSRAEEIRYQSKDNSVYDDRKDGSDNKGNISEMKKMVSDLTRQRRELESAIRRLSEEKADLEKDLHIQLEYRRRMQHQETESISAKDDGEARCVLQRQNGDLERRIATLKEEKAELENKLSRIYVEVNNLEDKLDNLKDERDSLEKEVGTLKDERQSVKKMVDDAKKGKAVETGSGRRQVQSGSPRHKDDKTPEDNRELQFTVTNPERETIHTELTNLKKQFALFQTELSTKSVHRDTFEMDEKDILELKRIRAEIEREVAVLRKRKTELETAISEVQDDTRREDCELKNMRKERMELELQITALKSQNTRLEAEGSVLKDERKKTENEVDGLRREKANLEKDVFSLQIKALQLESTSTESEGNSRKHEPQQYDNDFERQREEKDVISLQSEAHRLETEKVDLEKKVLSLQSEKHRLEDEARVFKDQQRRDENEVDRIRKEKVNLERDVFSLQNDKRREETEISLLKDKRHKEERDVEKLRREKADLEKDLLSLQIEKGRLESNISTGKDIQTTKTSDASGLPSNVQDLTENVERLKKQKEELQCEITRIEIIKKQGEEELLVLRREKTEIETIISALPGEYNSEGRQKNGHRDSYFDVPHSQEQLEKVKQELLAEITKIQTFKNQEENELQKLRQQKSEMGVYLQSEGGRLVMERTQSQPEPLEKGRTHIYLTDDDKKSDTTGFQDGEKTEEGDILHSTCHIVPDNTYNLNSYNSEESLVNGSYSYHPPLDLTETGTTNAFGDSILSEDFSKVNNDVISLKRERSELENRICDLRIQLTQLQTEVTSLENRKTILEAAPDSHISEIVSTGQMEAPEVHELADADVDFQLTKTTTEDRKDRLIQEYEEQIRELRQKRVELEQKVSVLEWQLENIKQKLELQEISHRREISSLNKENQSLNGYHNYKIQDTLREFYQKLSYFLMSGEHSNKEIMEEIERQIDNLQQKENFDYKITKESLTSPSVKLETDRLYRPESEVRQARENASHLKAQMETADNQLKTCEKIIHRLYGENSDLSEQNLNLEGQLKTASRSQDRLQRKKILLQKLVDKLSHHIGKDAQQQSYLLLELDKDVSL